MKKGLENDLFCNFGLKYGEDLGNQVAHPHQEFPGIDLRPGFCGIYPAVSPICHATASFPRLCSDVTSHVVTLTFSGQVASRTTNEQQNYLYDVYLHECIDFTLYRLTNFIRGTV